MAAAVVILKSVLIGRSFSLTQSGLSIQNLKDIPNTVELWVETLDEDVLIGRLSISSTSSKRGEKLERIGGWGEELCRAKGTLFWGLFI